MKSILLRKSRLSLLFWVSLLLLSSAHTGWANGEITTHEETTSSAVAVVISLIGGVIAILGIVVAGRGGRASSNVELKFGENKTITVTKLTQGAVIVLIGAAILIVGLYNLPTAKKEETIKAKTIEEKDGRRILKD